MENKNLSTCSKALDKASSKIKEFINSIIDKASFVETDAFLTGKGFESAFEALGEGVVTGYATVGGKPVHLFAQNSEVLKGSLSVAHAEKICKAMQRAIKSGTPFISIVDSCGARIGEGAGIMEGYAQIIAMADEVAANVPHLCIVKGNAVGMMATYVANADFTFVAKGAVVSVNSPMYHMSNTKSFPINYGDKFGFAAYEKGTDMLNFGFDNASELKSKLAKLLTIIFPADEEEAEDDANRVDPQLENAVDATYRINSVCDKDSVVEFCPNYAKEVKCSFAKLNGISVGVLATEKEYLTADGLEKAIDFINKLDFYDLPLITLVDSLGTNPDLASEYKGFAKLTSKLMITIANSSIEKIGVAVGNAEGYVYSALMSKGIGFDYTLATSNAVISPISCDTAVETVLKDQLVKDNNSDEMRAKLAEQYAQLQANPILAAKDGYIDNVIEATNLRPYLASALLMLLGI
ncbi:MAG: carboxyl transferase domain-containing protein [Clostridia bacterium]